MTSRIFRKLFPAARTEVPPQRSLYGSDHTTELPNRLDCLNREVASASLFVKRLRAVDSAYVSAAYDLVSFAEQRLANELLPGCEKWTQAWRGAVGAAIKSGNEERARALIIYLSLNFGISPELIRELEEMLPRG